VFVLISIHPLTDVSHKSVLLTYSSPLQISLRERERERERERGKDKKGDEESEREKDCSYWRQMRVR